MTGSSRADGPQAPSVGNQPNSLVRQQQQRVDRLLAEPAVDWAELRKYAYVRGLNPNQTDPRTLINTAHRSAYAGEAKVLRWCIEMGADVDARTTIGRAALHYACDGGSPECIRVLLACGADANLGTLSSLTPLHICCDRDHLEAALELLGNTRLHIDVDARARADAVLAEDMAKDHRIRQAIQRYREALAQKASEKRNSEMLERVVKRLFHAFDREGASYIPAEHWVESQSILLQYLSPEGDKRSEKACRLAEKRFDGGVSWEEFRASSLELIQELGGWDLHHFDLLSMLGKMEEQQLSYACLGA